MVVALLCGCEFITGALEPAAETDTDMAVGDALGEGGSMPGSGSAESGSTSASPPQQTSTTDDAQSEDEGGDAMSTSGARDPSWGTSGATSDGWSTTSGTGTPETYGGSCCEAGLGPMCEDPDVTACVCAIDSWCCEEEWDAICADLVEEAGCAACQKVGPTNTDNPSCCVPQDGPGCEMNDVALCVCQTDPYCCNMFWDGTCAAEVELFGCGECGIEGATTDIGPFGATEGDTDGTGPSSTSG